MTTETENAREPGGGRDWAGQLAEQWSWHWEESLRPRLQGLSDKEYLWEPAPGGWSVRPRGSGVATEVGDGPYVIDFAFPEPEPAPVTSIAWRLAHLVVGVFGMRNASHFGGPPMTYDTYSYSPSAATALAALDEGVAIWLAGVRSLSVDELFAPCGEAGHADDPLLALVLHIQREAIHHGAEIALLRDLYGSRAGYI